MGGEIVSIGLGAEFEGRRSEPRFRILENVASNYLECRSEIIDTEVRCIEVGKDSVNISVYGPEGYINHMNVLRRDQKITVANGDRVHAVYIDGQVDFIYNMGVGNNGER